MAELELVQIARKGLEVDVVVDAVDPALESGEVGLGRVDMDFAASVLAVPVGDGLVAGELTADIPSVMIRADGSTCSRIAPLSSFPVTWRLAWSGLAAALGQGHNLVLRGPAALAALLALTVNVSLANLDYLAE